MERSQIEREVRRVQYEVWADRALLWPLGAPPIHAMFDPGVVARKLGFELEVRERIPAIPGSNQRMEAAGTFDRRRRIICISTQFNYAVQRFTAAHEIGHSVLHRDIGRGVLHRDRPVYEMTSQRPPIEQEADYFAACLLVPLKLLHEAFEQRFGTRKPLPLTDTVAFHLRKSASHELFDAPKPARAFASALASARSFDRRRFTSLTEHFGVSVSAMAIRLEEAGLVVD